MSLRIRRAMICGARGGIGEALVEALLKRRETEKIYGSVREHPGERLEQLAQADARLSLMPIDLQREDTIAAAANDVGRETASLDLLINATGLLHREGLSPEKRLRDVDPSAMAELFAVNATGPLLLAKHFHELLRGSEPTALVNLSARVGSIADNRLGGWYGYRSSKAALNMLTRGLSIELRRRAPQLVVAAIHPGTVATDLSAPFRGNVPQDALQTPATAAARILSVVESLTGQDSGGFFAYDGEPIEW